MTVRTTISMPDDVWDLIADQQEASGAPVSEIVRRAVVAYLSPPKKKVMRRAK